MNISQIFFNYSCLKHTEADLIHGSITKTIEYTLRSGSEDAKERIREQLRQVIEDCSTSMLEKTIASQIILFASSEGIRVWEARFVSFLVALKQFFDEETPSRSSVLPQLAFCISPSQLIQCLYDETSHLLSKSHGYERPGGKTLKYIDILAAGLVRNTKEVDKMIRLSGEENVKCLRKLLRGESEGRSFLKSYVYYLFTFGDYMKADPKNLEIPGTFLENVFPISTLGVIKRATEGDILASSFNANKLFIQLSNSNLRDA